MLVDVGNWRSFKICQWTGFCCLFSFHLSAFVHSLITSFIQLVYFLHLNIQYSISFSHYFINWVTSFLCISSVSHCFSLSLFHSFRAFLEILIFLHFTCFSAFQNYFHFPNSLFIFPSFIQYFSHSLLAFHLPKFHQFSIFSFHLVSLICSVLFLSFLGGIWVG